MEAVHAKRSAAGVVMGAPVVRRAVWGVTGVAAGAGVGAALLAGGPLACGKEVQRRLEAGQHPQFVLPFTQQLFRYICDSDKLSYGCQAGTCQHTPCCNTQILHQVSRC